MIRFTIPYPESKKGRSDWHKKYGLNAYYSGKNPYVRTKAMDELHLLAKTAMKQARIRKNYVESPVEISFFWDDRWDIDNHAILGKAIVDAMKGYILPDDNRRWVKKVSHEFWDGGEIAVEVSKYD